MIIPKIWKNNNCSRPPTEWCREAEFHVHICLNSSGGYRRSFTNKQTLTHHCRFWDITVLDSFLIISAMSCGWTITNGLDKTIKTYKTHQARKFTSKQIHSPISSFQLGNVSMTSACRSGSCRTSRHAMHKPKVRTRRMRSRSLEQPRRIQTTERETNEGNQAVRITYI